MPIVWDRSLLVPRTRTCYFTSDITTKRYRRVNDTDHENYQWIANEGRFDTRQFLIPWVNMVMDFSVGVKGNPPWHPTVSLSIHANENDKLSAIIEYIPERRTIYLEGGRTIDI